LEDTLPYLFALLSIEEQPSPLAQMDPQIRRRRTFEALKKLFLRESLNQPLVLIFEDLHWIDGEMQGFLDVLCESLASAKLLLLTNYRPEYKHEWGQKTYYTQLRLAPFGKEEAEEFLDVLLGQSPLPAGERVRVRGVENDFQTLKQLILDKTQGTPFFMEEIVQELREQDLLTDLRRVGSAHQYLDLHLPTTVQAVLAARIDRLTPEEKALLQQLSVIGRQFPLSLIRQVVAQPEADLYRLLASLQHKEFLYEQPAFPESEYLFKHALTQDVAYGSVLVERRKVLHEQTGQAIELLYQDKLEEHYAELAHHYQRGGNAEKAIAYLQKVGQQALQRSANQEAIAYLNTALELMTKLPDTPERAEREMLLQIQLASPLRAIKGYGAPEVERAYNRAHQLAQQTKNTTLRFAVLRGLWGVRMTQGQTPAVLELSEHMLQLAQQQLGTAPVIEAHWARGCALMSAGKFREAYAELEQGYASYRCQRHSSDAFLYSQDPGVGCLAYMGWVLWFLGYPEQARQKGREAIALAHETAHPLNVAVALGTSLVACGLRHDVQLSHEYVDALFVACAEHGFSQWVLIGELFHAWLLAEDSDDGEGLTRMYAHLPALRANGIGLGFGLWFFVISSELFGKAGHIAEAMTLIDEAFERMVSGESYVLESELYRLKGELLLQQENQKPVLSVVEGAKGKGQKAKVETEAQSEAEACFLKAAEIAQKQQAKSLELRAATSLARLWQTQGKHHAARNMLADVYNWFTEGFDTKDLQEAKALLAELADREIGPSGH
jgi:tetratricopeptide (TPR) repeat protein